jgi:predicted ATPase
MHRQIATALEARHAGDAHAVCEHLAHHYTAAKVWDKAVYYLQQAGEKACQALAPETALHYYDQALEVLNHLESGAGSAAEQARWQEKRLQILASRQEVVNILGYAAT